MEATRIAVAGVHKAKPTLRLGLVTVNRGDESGIRVNIVRDARRGETDAAGCLIPSSAPSTVLDHFSVRGICSATANRIDCAEGAVRALLDGEQSSLALVLVLLHELGHVALRHSGTFVEETRAIDLSRPWQEKLTQLANLCFSDARQLALEREADFFAQEALAEVLKAPPFYDPLASAAGSVGLVLPSSHERLEALKEWATARTGGAVEPVDLGSEPLCSLLHGRQRHVLLPVLRGSHPRGERRMADLTTRLAKMTTGLSTKPDVDTTNPAAALGNGQELMHSMAGIVAAMDREDAEADEATSDAFCREVNAVEADRARCR